MKLEILKPIAGRGDFVKGSAHTFSLDRGMIVEVEDSTAVKWIQSGIAKAIPKVPEATVLKTPENAMRPRPTGRPRKAK